MCGICFENISVCGFLQRKYTENPVPFLILVSIKTVKDESVFTTLELKK